jgi:hypothetical protein
MWRPLIRLGETPISPKNNCWQVGDQFVDLFAFTKKYIAQLNQETLVASSRLICLKPTDNTDHGWHRTSQTETMSRLEDAEREKIFTRRGRRECFGT